MNKVIKLSSEDIKSVLQRFLVKGWNLQESKNPHVLWSLHGNDLVVMAYSSGKVMIQGRDSSTEWRIVNQILESDESQASNVPHVGVDEAGKGDFFGPLVTASAYVDNNIYPKLISLGITDSKKISDKKIEKIFNEIKGLCMFEVSVLMPAEYNQLYKQFNNGNKLLANQHSLVIENLLKKLIEADKKVEFVLIDQFSKNKSRVSSVLGELGRSVEFRQMHKGEEDIAVATASIIARYFFVKSLEDMEKEWDFKFPKGATDVINAGKEFVKRFGQDDLNKVAKTNFKTVNQVFSLF